MSNPGYAPNPKKQQVYRNLQNKKLSDVTAKDIQQLTDPTFIQATNQDALITYNMLNKAMMRDGLPMPGTLHLEVQTFTSVGYRTFFTPGKGEVWRIIGCSVASTTGLSGTGIIEVDITNTTTFNRLILVDQSFTSSSDFPATEISFTGAAYVDENHRVTIRAEGTWTSVNNVCLGLIRIR